MEAEVWSKSLVFVQTLSTLVKILKFRRDFEAEVWSVFCFCCLVEVRKLNLGQYSEARFGQDFNLRFCRDADVWLRFCSWRLVEILKMKFDQDLNFKTTQPLGFLCLW